MNIERAISYIRVARELDDGDETLNRAISAAFHSVVNCKNADTLRSSLPMLGDLDVPARLVFAMHVQILLYGGGQSQDKNAFADFIDPFYGEWSEWANALRATHK